MRPPTSLSIKTGKTSNAKHRARHRARHRAPLTSKTIAVRAVKASPAVGVAGALVAALATHGAPVATPSAAAYRASTTANWRAASKADSGGGTAGTSGQPASPTSSPSASGWFGLLHGTPGAISHTVTTHTVTKHTVTKHPAPKPWVAAQKCTGTSGMLPANYAAIMSFLTTHGYTRMAAAGIAGNMFQESKGDPESVGTGGGGLIGFTPLPAGYVTGNPAADLRTQLEAVLSYNQQWAQYIPALNAATTPTEAADIYMNDFERPGIPAAYNREGAANAVAAACGF